ncbi:polysaccharide biosynthesis/export family protein [Tuwongella immobilis]|uniref:Polysaccharide export protein:: Poly_export n=1 Tax=Tuwongella immobilis TaxID=692036 RepID=A0A6C2YRM6_9BACT|nr:polysaccharide biosynthesis/export family protein [Tuwongella immobilis]VIP03819.1 polysaccharide export protein : : Poly_export [Tuwongella immobilis]VTS05005.1 polysaccharide export protein : : Poly_export [Tuwongella immobilis]
MSVGIRAWMVALAVLPWLGGCASDSASRNKSCLPCQAATVMPPVSNLYVIGFGDVLTVGVIDGQETLRESMIDEEGRFDLGELGRVRLEGQTILQASHTLGQVMKLPPERISLHVSEHGRGMIIVLGPAEGVQRLVPYRGPESILDFLRRIDSMRLCVALRTIHVVRPNVALGKAPEIFAVSVPKILEDDDSEQNLRLEPFDRVVIGTTWRAELLELMPPWARSLLLQTCKRCGIEPAQPPAAPLSVPTAVPTGVR